MQFTQSVKLPPMTSKRHEKQNHELNLENEQLQGLLRKMGHEVQRLEVAHWSKSDLETTLRKAATSLKRESQNSTQRLPQGKSSLADNENSKQHLWAANLVSKVAELEAQISELTTINEISGSEVKRLQQASVRKAEDATKGTSKKVAKLEENISQLIELNEASSSEVKRLQEALVQSHASDKEARDLLALQSQAVVTTQTSTIADLKARISDLSELNEVSGSEAQRLQESLQQSQASDTEARDLLVQAWAKVAELEARISELNTANEVSVSQVQRFQESQNLDSLSLPTLLAHSRATSAASKNQFNDASEFATEVEYLQESLMQSQAKAEETHDLLVRSRQDHKKETFHLQTQIAGAQVELKKLRKENAELKQDLAHNESDMLRQHSKTVQGRPMPECIQLILSRLMNDPKYQCSSASQAWAFFEPDSSKQVNHSSFREKIIGLDVLTEDEVSGLLEYMDYGGSGSIDYEEWTAGLMMALATSSELHALLTEREFNAIMLRIKSKFTAQGKTVTEAFQSCDLDTSKSLSFSEFQDSMRNLKIGLSQKEIQQTFIVMDADKSGMIEMDEFVDAIEEGADADVMKQVATPILRQVGEALILKSCVEECQELATPVGSDMLSFDGFVQVIRLGHPGMTLSSIMRLWCIVDKCGQGGMGFANIPDLVSNILAATMLNKPRDPAATT